MYAVVTTIAEPTSCMWALVKRLQERGGTLIAVGDEKGPATFDTPNTVFLPLSKQLDLPFALAKRLPISHYARKNLGYLYAFKAGAPCLYETDDDNAPNEHWQLRERQVQARRYHERGWVNTYRFYTDDLIWPRGMPLDQIRCQAPLPKLTDLPAMRIDAPIQQGLAQHAPDVDALWRLLLDKPFAFKGGDSVALAPGAWCPFNSQSTWWWPEAYPLMYLPSYCSFRMTDIWRSFIAQRCLWAIGKHLVFHPAEVYQDRNAHNLMRDFEAEIDGYLGNTHYVEILDALDLASGPENVTANLLTCYDALVRAAFFPDQELDLVRAWIDDLAQCEMPALAQASTKKFSLVTTCLNEHASLSQWRQDLEGQTRFPDEVVIVDANSTDGTYEALLRWAASDVRIKIYQQPCSVANGRNLAIENTSHALIISTDMGVRLHPQWVEAITQPFEDDPTVDVVMGNYEVDPHSIKSPASRAECFISGTGSPFIIDVHGDVQLKEGIVPGNRSIAYRKSVWQALGGLPSDLSYAADDSVFGRQLQRSDYYIAYAPEAMVYWERPQALARFWKEQRGYGRGDGEAAIKTPLAFRWHAHGRLPAWLVPWLTGCRWLAKRCTISGLLMAIKRFDVLAALYILPLQFGNGYSFGCGYLVGDAYGKVNCQACRGRLTGRELQA